jgi:hypothetical protein
MIHIKIITTKIKSSEHLDWESISFKSTSIIWAPKNKRRKKFLKKLPNCPSRSKILMID